MSKTVDLQVGKCRFLIERARKNMEELKEKGFSPEELDTMNAELDALHAASVQCDTMRKELSAKVGETNNILQRVKATFAEQKKRIKSSYPPEQWMKYGVQDKR